MLSVLQKQGQLSSENIASSLVLPFSSTTYQTDPETCSLIPNPASIVVSPIPRFASSTSGGKERLLRTSLHVCIWFRTSTNSYRRKHLKPPVSAPTSTLMHLAERNPDEKSIRTDLFEKDTLSRSPAKKASISAFAPTPTMSSASTRCCPAPAPTGCKRVCAEPGASPTAPSPASTLARSSSPSVLVISVRDFEFPFCLIHGADCIVQQTAPPPSRPSAARCTSSPAVKRSSSPRTGASLLFAARSTSRLATRARLGRMVLTCST